MILIPHAGGAASAYRGWRGRLPDDIELCPVQLPGREHRFDEQLIDSLPALVSAMADGLDSLLDRPYGIYGHSMGAWLAFELARELRTRARPLPRFLMAGAAPAPDVPDPQQVHLMSLDEAIAYLREGGQTSSDILDNREIMEMAWPILRADAAITETHRFEPGAPLDCPITVLAAEDDHLVTDDMLGSWRHHTTGSCEVKTVSGGHLFHTAPTEEVLAIVAKAVIRGLDVSERP